MIEGRFWKRAIILLCACMTLFFSSAAFAQASAEGQAYVQVASSQIRERPSVLSPILAAVSYRDHLVVIEENKGWALVYVPGTTRTGYIFLSAISNKAIGADGYIEAPASGVSSTEIALAGKGFNESLESTYRKNSKVDYSWVDAMERFEFSQEECVQFLAGGSGR